MAREKLDRTDYIASQIERAKKPTEIYTEFAAWIADNTGVSIKPAHLQIGGRLYMEFQKENRENGTGRSRGSAKAVAKPKVNEQPADLDEPVAKTEVATPNKKVPARSKPVAKVPAKAGAKPGPRRGKVAASEEAPY